MPLKFNRSWSKWACNALCLGLIACESVDLAPQLSSSSEMQSVSSSSANSDFIHTQGDTLLWDGRSERFYKIARIGKDLWMLENLAYGDRLPAGQGPTSPSRIEGTCLEDSLCAEGYLYLWSEALSLPAKCLTMPCLDTLKSPLRGPCPPGWTLPMESDFVQLQVELQSKLLWQKAFVQLGDNHAFLSLGESDSSHFWAWSFYDGGLASHKILAKTSSLWIRCMQRSL